MLINPLEPIRIPPIDRVPSLPYWETYQEWMEHLNECGHCVTVMTVGTQEIKDLCLMGRLAATAVEWDIGQQRDLSALN